jgi:hypothetical protein
MPLAGILRAAAISMLVGACSGADGSSDATTVADSVGVRLITNGGTGAWGVGPVRVVEVLRIGVLDGDDAYQFHEIYALAVAEDGTIFVGNNQTATVRVFSPSGEFLRELGGRGRGPGEYIMVNDVWLAGDGVAVTDWQGGGRTGVYSRDGELLHFWSSTRPDRSRITPVGRTPGGWVAYYDPPYELPTVAPGEVFRRPRTLHRFLPEANDTAERILDLPTRALYGSPQTEGADWALFDPRLTYELDAAGNVYVVRGENYRIDVYDPAGRHVRGISRTHEPVPIRDEDVALLKERITAFYDSLPARGTRDSRDERDRVLERVDRQRGFNPRPHLPPLGRLLVSPDGSFWIERADVADPATLEFERLFGGFGRAGPRETRWDLFDADGVYLASAALDARFAPMAVRGPEITGVYKDDLDVEYVVTFRAAPATGEDATAPTSP